MFFQKSDNEPSFFAKTQPIEGIESSSFRIETIELNGIFNISLHVDLRGRFTDEKLFKQFQAEISKTYCPDDSDDDDFIVDMEKPRGFNFSCIIGDDFNHFTVKTTQSDIAKQLTGMLTKYGILSKETVIEADAFIDKLLPQSSLAPRPF